MASTTKHIMSLLHLIILFFLFSISLIQIHAREGKFFSKVTLPENPKEAANPNNFNNKQPFHLPTQSYNGHGLYSYNPNPDATTNTNPNNFVTYNDNNINGNGNGDLHSFPSSFTIGSDQFKDHKRISSAYDNNNVKQDYDESKQYYGMSDTRFIENGKYFYDVNAEKNYQHAGNYYPKNSGSNVGAYGMYNYNGVSRPGNNHGHGEHYKYDNSYGYDENQRNYNVGGQYQNNQELEDYDPLDP